MLIKKGMLEVMKFDKFEEEQDWKGFTVDKDNIQDVPLLDTPLFANLREDGSDPPAIDELVAEPREWGSRRRLIRLPPPGIILMNPGFEVLVNDLRLDWKDNLESREIWALCASLSINRVTLDHQRIENPDFKNLVPGIDFESMTLTTSADFPSMTMDPDPDNLFPAYNSKATYYAYAPKITGSKWAGNELLYVLYYAEATGTVPVNTGFEHAGHGDEVVDFAPSPGLLLSDGTYAVDAPYVLFDASYTRKFDEDEHISKIMSTKTKFTIWTALVAKDVAYIQQFMAAFNRVAVHVVFVRNPDGDSTSAEDPSALKSANQKAYADKQRDTLQGFATSINGDFAEIVSTGLTDSGGRAQYVSKVGQWIRDFYPES